MAITLPPLRFPDDGLSTVFSADALRYHHEHHHGGYVRTVNRLISGRELDFASLDEIISGSSGQLANAAAQAWNHEFFWESMSPHPAQPDADLGGAIERSFGSLSTLARRFRLEGGQLFGSGWIWLVADAAGMLHVLPTSNAGFRLHQGSLAPVLACDVWEHAYYTDYLGDRLAYLDAFWSIIDWHAVGRRYRERDRWLNRKRPFADALIDKGSVGARKRRWHPRQATPEA